MKTFKAVKCFQDNGPEYWIVTDKTFKGTVLASCDTEEAAQLIARAVNNHDSLLDGLKLAVEEMKSHHMPVVLFEALIAKAEGLDKERA